MTALLRPGVEPNYSKTQVQSVVNSGFLFNVLTFRQTLPRAFRADTGYNNQIPFQLVLGAETGCGYDFACPPHTLHAKDA
jgi:hypothetical protein